ncbi:MAG TPA: ATP-binding SpoIIE family protein phosphatase [Burkholderiaceae bacterium]
MNSSLPSRSALAIEHASDIAAARRAGQQLADELGFDQTRAGQLAIVVTEACTNLIKHAERGTVLLSPVSQHGVHGIDVLALDKGPGIANLGASMHDGVSSAGTAGNGLGALRRLSGQFDVYSAPGRGSAFFMRIWAAAPPPAQSFSFGAVILPLAGETACGDAWAVLESEQGLVLIGADGLGHGPDAAEASALAVRTIAAMGLPQPSPAINAAHQALRITRGAALAVASVPRHGGDLVFAGIGNIAACVVGPDGARKQLVSHNGIVGNNMRKVQDFVVPCPPGSLCIMHSDGLATQWSLDDYPGLAHCAPSLVAGVLLRDYGRGRDDAMVLAVRVGTGAAP